MTKMVRHAQGRLLTGESLAVWRWGPPAERRQPTHRAMKSACGGLIFENQGRMGVHCCWRGLRTAFAPARRGAGLSWLSPIEYNFGPVSNV
jgi:hypothetical protein